MPSDTHSQNESLNATELGMHLSVSCSKSIARIVGRLGLEPVAGGYPWRRIFRAIHRTEGHVLAQHLVALKATHGTPDFDEIEDAGARAAARAAAQGSPIIDAITDLESELRAPLWHFDKMSRAPR